MSDSDITQRGRLLAVHSILPFDVLLLDSFVGSEAISAPFRFEVKLLADTLSGKHLQVKPQQIIGSSMSIEMQLPAGSSRFFNGVVNRFSQDGQDGKFASYRAELVPWFSLLTLTSDCRIFQNASAPEIIEKVIDELGFTSLFGNPLKSEDRSGDPGHNASDGGNYRSMDYCVQYRESDFNFLSRLMEEEGIFYYFEHITEHGQIKHRMVLNDSPRYPDNPIQSNFVFSGETGRNDRKDNISSWESHTQLINGMWSLRDHHFEMPRNTLEVIVPALSQNERTESFEIYDYPGEYAQRFNEPGKRLDKVHAEGELLVRKRMEQDECHCSVIHGVSQSRAFSSGFKISVTGGKEQRADGSFLLTSIHHSALQHPPYVNRPGVDSWYDNSFTAIPANVPFRPRRVTPKPLVHGAQTATEISDEGASDEEVWTDQYGRVKVRFHWDREEKYACWVRVGQVWAGNGFGFQWVPRVGDEVIVDFLDGDPDAPIIVGSVYNASQMPPFTLPDHKTQGGIKTHSTPKGNSQNFNMLRFEDKKGHECLEIHAEKTMIEGVEGSQFITVGGSRSISTGGEKDGKTHGDTKEIVFKNRNLHVKGDSRTKIDGKSSDTVVGDEIHATTGGYYLSSGKTVLVHAPELFLQGDSKITLQVGGSFIELAAAGVTIVGTMVKLNPAAAVPPTAPTAPLSDPPEDP